MEQIFKSKAGESVLISTMQQGDLDAADQVTRLAFGTFLGMPDPSQFMGDADFVHTRWKADPTAAFCASIKHEIVGSVFAGNWGSVGFFGPLTTHPKLWDQGIAKYLMAPVMECFQTWGSKHLGLFTFAQSIKHVSLYQKFGFYPRFLTAIMGKPVQQKLQNIVWSCFSDAGQQEAASLLKQCYTLTDSVFEGLDLTREIQSVSSQNLGETVLLWAEGNLAGIAICHCGPGTEAGSGTCYIKFGVVAPGSRSGQRFEELLIACEQLAGKRSLNKIVGGVNTARRKAYERMLANGYAINGQGVVMQQPDAGYNREDVYLIDDWR
ncbi:GNAT family N-acetyltransferase [Puia sp.]|jgi:GNAT superfamily N-acetyltransferase|uniref:GNAT family N-acetyltransferase n=1 Tax=Puia sp. TaxID=2045100 RepID=UPI002F3E430C